MNDVILPPSTLIIFPVDFFDFELAKRDLTIATFIPAHNQSKKLLDDWRTSWLAKGFKISIGSEEEIKNSQLLSTIKHNFLEELCAGERSRCFGQV